MRELLSYSFGLHLEHLPNNPAANCGTPILVILEGGGNLKEVEPGVRSYITRGIPLRETVGYWPLALSLCASWNKMYKVSSSLCPKLPTGPVD